MCQPIRFLLALTIACALAAPGAGSAATTAEVSITSYAFTPPSLTINVDDSVLWRNNATGDDHAVASDSGLFTSPTIIPGGTFLFHFTTVGDFPYRCSIHPTLMAGVIHVIGPTPPTIISGLPPGGVLGVAYAYALVSTGSTPFTYGISGGNLPTGLSLSNDGVISGTPTALGIFTGSITVSNGNAPDSTQNFSIPISTTAVAPTIVSAAPTGGTVGVAYRQTYQATGTAAISYTLTAGALPTGLQLSSGGILSGTPTASGTFTGAVTASNGTGPDSTQPFSIAIADGSGGGGTTAGTTTGKGCGSGAKVALLLLAGLATFRRRRI